MGRPDHSSVRGPLPPLTAFPRAFFVEACSRLACNARLHGCARSAPLRVREVLASRSTTTSPNNRVLCSFWAIICRQGVCLRVFLSYSSSLTPEPREASATVPAPPLWKPALVAVCSDLRYTWNAPKIYATQAS